MSPPVRRSSRKRSARSTSSRRSTCHRPSAWTSGARSAASRRSSCSSSPSSPTRSCQSRCANRPVDARACRSARMRAGRDVHAVGSTTGTGSAGITRRRKCSAASAASGASRGSSSSNVKPCSASMPRSGSNARGRSVYGSASRRNRNASGPASQRSDAGSATVASSDACSHSSSTRLPSRSSRWRPTPHGARTSRARPSSTQRVTFFSSAR